MTENEPSVSPSSIRARRRPTRTAALGALAVLAMLASASCKGAPRLRLVKMSFAETGNAERPIEWRASVFNDPERSFPLSLLCRPAPAKAVIHVGVHLAKDRHDPVSRQVFLGNNLLTDGGDPDHALPDEIGVGETVIASLQRTIHAPSDEDEDTWVFRLEDYPWAIFRLESRVPPVVNDEPPFPHPFRNSVCARWNERRVVLVSTLVGG